MMSTDTPNQLWRQKRESAINIGLAWVEGLLQHAQRKLRVYFRNSVFMEMDLQNSMNFEARRGTWETFGPG